MMEAVSTSETSDNFYETIRRNIPEDSHFHRLRVLEKRRNGKILDRKERKEQDVKEIHKAKLYNLYSSHTVRKETREVAHGAKRKARTTFVGNRERKRPLGRPRRMWQDNIQDGLQKLECDSANCIHLA
jgi:BRCT domain type II-containing protein